MSAEGWFKDPYRIHEARWFSDGTPTPLVKDGDQESSDPPPDVPVSGELERIYQHEAANGGDLRRVGRDDSYDPAAAIDAAERAVDRMPNF